MAQEPAVPGVVAQILSAAIDQRENTRVTAVRHFQQHCAVAVRRILGTDGHEIGPELDFTVLEIDGVLQIHDAPIVLVGDGHGEVHAPVDAFISSSIAKRLPAEYVCFSM